MIEHRVLGPLEIDVDGAPVVLKAAKLRALVCLLLLARGRPVSRDELIDRLWAGSPPPSAVQTLQSYVANVRRALEPGAGARDATVLQSHPGGYVLATGDLDADRFEREHAAGREALARGQAADAVCHLEGALALWRGRALSELPDDAAARAEATRLEDLRLSAVEDLAETRVEAGQLAVAAASLRHLLVEHPLRERARGLLALCCYRDGRQAQALEVIQEGRQVLADELGLDPGPELQRLERAILRQDRGLEVASSPLVPGHAPQRSSATVPAGTPVPGTAPTAPPRVPLVGRDDELRTVLTAAEQGGVLLVSGEAGVGKTRLLTELVERVSGTHLVLQGRCPDAEGVPPHWLWRQVLSGVRGDLGSVRDVDGPFAVGIAIAERLRLAARERSLLVVLEDVHSADEAGLRVLQVVCEELRGSPATVAVSFRSEDAGRQPLAGTLAVLARSPRLVRVELAGLDESGVVEYVASLTGASVTPERAAALLERTAGNPFFLGELARLGAGVEGVPPGVRDVIRLRVAQLPSAAVELLRAAAVLGRDASVRVVMAMADADADSGATLDAVDAIVGSGLATEPVGGRLRFMHALVREAILEELSGVRLAALHARAANALERVGADPAVLAHHRVAAVLDGPDERAAGCCLVAARRALEELAVEEAVRLAAVGADLAPSAAAQLRLDLLLVEAAARRGLGDLDGADRALDEAIELARGSGDARRFALAALTRAGGTVQGFWTTPSVGDTSLAATLQEAVSLLGADDDALRARVLAELVVQLQFDGRAEEAQRLAVQARAAAAATDDRGAALAALRAAYAAAAPERLDDQVRLVEALLAEAAGRTDILTACLLLRANRLLACGRVDEADEAAGEATRLAEGHRLPDLVLLCDAWRIRRGLLVGAWDGAESRWQEMAGRAELLGPAAQRLAANEWTSIRGILAWQRGGFDELLDEIDARVRAGTVQWRAVLPLALAEAGRLDEAHGLVEGLVSATDGPLPFRAMPSQGLAWLAETVTMLGGHPRASELRARLEPYRGQLLVPRFGAGCLGAVESYLGGLRLVSGDLDGAVADLVEAVARDDAAGARPFAVRARHRLAAALLERADHGDAARAATVWRDARDEAEALGMAPLQRQLDDLGERLASTG